MNAKMRLHTSESIPKKHVRCGFLRSCIQCHAVLVLRSFDWLRTQDCGPKT